MPDAQPLNSSLVFGDFIEHLRRHGFTIGVGHHLRLQQLLLKVGAECAPQDLKTLLCPIFATSQKEQAFFYEAFDAFFDFGPVEGGAGELRPESGVGAHDEEDLKPLPPPSPAPPKRLY